MAEKTYEERRRELFAAYTVRLKGLGYGDPGYPALWDERTLALEMLREEFGVK